MDEGPQVKRDGADAVGGADTGTDPGEPAAGVAGDVTATQPGPRSADEMPTEGPAPAEQAASDAAAADQAAADQPVNASQTPAVAAAPDALPMEEPAPAAQHSPEPTPAEEPDAVSPLPVSELAAILTALSALGGRLDDIANAVAEVSRLRSRDADLIARLHDDVTRLRSGEIATALNPVVTGMIRLHDQMVSLGALDDPASPVGMLRTQLLQIMELTCAVHPFTPVQGERFDASRHMGARRIPTTDASADGTIASTIKAGFAHADGSVVRVAEVEVHRLSG